MNSDWRTWTKTFPFKGITDPEYIKERNKTFNRNGNGWWYNDGLGWGINWKSPQELYKERYKAKQMKLIKPPNKQQ